MDASWRNQRRPDGAWCYVAEPFDEDKVGGGGKGRRTASPTGLGGELTMSMTAAGVATLFLTQEYA